MKPRNKIIILFLAALAGMVIIACSCTDLSSLGGTNDEVREPEPTVRNNEVREPELTSTNDDVSEPDLAGTWQDPETADIFVITRTGSGYEVTSVTWEDTTYQITEQAWDGSSLTWTYYIPENEVYLTYVTTSLDGDSLYTDWSNSQGDAGTEILDRVR